jgi:hypothetical protein
MRIRDAEMGRVSASSGITSRPAPRAHGSITVPAEVADVGEPASEPCSDETMYSSHDTSRTTIPSRIMTRVARTRAGGEQ